jgi:DNA recombination protein RmuC
VDILTSLIFLAVGAGAGFGVALLLFRKDTAGVEARIRTEVRTESESERVRLTTELEAVGKRAQEYVAESRKKDERLEWMAAKLTGLERREAELIATLQAEKEATEEKLALVSDAKLKLEEAFTALSKKALDQNSESFVNYAKSVLDGYQKSAQEDLHQRQARISELVEPVKESLDKVDDRIHELEKERAGAYGELREQITQMSATQQQLRSETANLVKALRNSNTRGQWGELQLKRIVELAGMKNYCDFQEQASVATEEGKHRPDMIIKMPTGHTIVVDAKAPMGGFLDAHEAGDDAARKTCFVRHAQQLRAHIGILSQKAYFNSFEPSPEFVLLFLPNEALFSVALEHDPLLLEDGARNNVIVATPTTLIALLKAANYGWKQESITKEVQQVGALGRELYERLSKLSDHVVTLGNSLTKSVQAYNDMIGSMEHRVLVSARRFKKLNVTSDSTGEIKELQPVEVATRNLQAPELLQQSDDIVTPAADVESFDKGVSVMPQVASAKIAG